MTQAPASLVGLLCFLKKFLTVLIPIAVISLITGLLLHASCSLDPPPLSGDANQNFRSAFNLASSGEYGESLDGTQPGFRREPLPNFILAGHLIAVGLTKAEVSLDNILGKPDLLSQALRVNLFYIFVLFLGLWGLCLLLVRPLLLGHLVAGVVIYSSYESFIFRELNNYYTELPASALIVLTGLALASLRRRANTFWALVTGMVFGLLVLTKAAGSYVALLLIPFLPYFLRIAWRRAVKLTLCLGLGFALSVLPWVVRNQIEFNQAAVAQGGGRVLLIRSVFNEMNGSEYKGAFYAFAPKKLREGLFEPLLGYSQSDLECGGPLQRLRRDLPCDEISLSEKRYQDLRSFYQVGKRGLPRELSEAGINGEDSLRDVAIDKIQSKPLKHVLVSLPFAWRGVWSFKNRWPWFRVVVNGLAMLSLLVMPVIGLILPRPDWLLMSVVGVSYFWFYAAFSHFIPRYSAGLIPLSLVCLSILLVESTHVLLCRLRRGLALGC